MTTRLGTLQVGLLRPLLVTLVVAATLPSALHAQRAGQPTVQQFLAEARQATQRYQRPEAAIADGFKRVGVEFPAMGEHWVSLSRVMEDTLVASRPAVLIYTTVRGRAQLAGVGYTALLDPGEQPPAWAPARGFWHEHNGSVAEESLPALHGAGHTRTVDPGGMPPIRLAIMHAWIWTENPAGVFETDNWALPPRRVGAAAGARHPRGAVRGMALATDEEGYYLQTITARLGLSPAEQARVAPLVTAHRARAQAALRDGIAAAPLAAAWQSLWRELATALPARARGLRTLEAEL